ncbi:Glutathione-regulated potassium-efflux system ATP-binding protein [Methylophaga frappieri]|uniref:Probable ATP-binding protein YheS n=1 Tax=Methylophaga frappieri (strain ATCC BAA-2434 / DSM 25690 / JAM7) TaxID=754477 RepID=I1YGC5_METFJ|nr:ATP-binding cassette domain-containing protein [Methylophaga frappieri]AFJ01968.1 Glutathione-regulated potassium-efflux system ATP-binding protein [Methylophaga frappieri]
MIKLTQLILRRGPRVLFEQANLVIHPGQRVGLTGANGAGKSSLFAMMRGQLSADSGDLDMPANWVIAHVAQETPAVDTPAIDYVLEGDAPLSDLLLKLAEAERQEDGHQQTQLHDALSLIDGYSGRSRAARLLHGLGFSAAQQTQAVRSFSGGWRMRLNLAQALMCRSDLLLLDEPTNHLDLEAVYWLEEWLRQYSGTLIVISHDRDFLDRVVNQIAHIEQQRIKLYTGNYSDFEQARAMHLANQQAAHDKQQREVAHIRSFVNRFKAKATKAKQAQSRLKALARMEMIAPAHVDSPFHFRFFEPSRLTTPILALDEASAGYNQQPLLTSLKLSLNAGDRIGLLGPNGAGKSTLIKLIAGELTPLSGKRREGKDIVIGYFAQHQLEQLRPDESPLQHMQRLDVMASEQVLRDYLGGFGFHGDEAVQKVAPFSGGEKARLVLAILVYQRPALLLLDEPTNHLDLEMRHALTMALQEYDGALVVVSHDRYFLRNVTDDLWLVAEGQAKAFAGDLDDYRLLRLGKDNDSASKTALAKPKKADRQAAAQQRQRLQPLKKKVQRAEQLMDKQHQQLQSIEAQLAAPELYEAEQKDQLKQLLQQQSEFKSQLAQTELEWLEASEDLTRAEQETA